MLLFIVLILLFTGEMQLTNLNSSDRVEEHPPYVDLQYSFSDSFEPSRIFLTINPVNGDLYLFSRFYEYLIRMTESGEITFLDYPTIDHDSNQFIDVSKDGRSLIFWDVSAGKVHQMDLETGELERLDNSFTHRSMYYHAGALNDDNSIYAVGGYGFWEFRNILIKFTPDIGEWEKLPSQNRANLPKSQRGILYANHDVLHYILSDHTTEASHFSPIQAWNYSIENESWQKNEHLTSLLKRAQPLFATKMPGSMIFTSSYVVDRYNGHIGFLSGSSATTTQFFLADVRNDRLFTLSPSSLGMRAVYAALFSESRGVWVLLGSEDALSLRDILIARTFQFDEENPLFTEVVVESSRLPIAMGIFLVSLTLFVSVFLFFRNHLGVLSLNGKRNKQFLTLQQKEESVEAYVNGKDLNSEKDELIDRFVSILYSMKERDQSELLITELDSRLFNINKSIHHTSYSRNRKRLIQFLNDALGETFIVQRKSKVDKRFKVVSVQLDCIKIES